MHCINSTITFWATSSFFVNNMVLLYLIKKPWNFPIAQQDGYCSFWSMIFDYLQTKKFTFGSWCIVTITESGGANQNSILSD
jgi:hypothetical protein